MNRGPSRPGRRAVAFAALAAAGIVAAAAPACSYPDFQFGDEDGGAGGDGAQGGGPSSSSSGPASPQVHCHVPPVLCGENQACCLHESDAALDVCADAGTCGPLYSELRCNNADDCPPTAPICCAKDDDGDFFPDGIGCQATCDAIYEAPMCKVQGDCPGGTECKPLIVDYENYDACLPP